MIGVVMNRKEIRKLNAIQFELRRMIVIIENDLNGINNEKIKM